MKRVGLFFVAVALLAASALAQTATTVPNNRGLLFTPNASGSPMPISPPGANPVLVHIVGKDSHDNILYTRTGYLYLSPPDQPGYNGGFSIENYFVSWWMRMHTGSECGVLDDLIIETAYDWADYCNPPGGAQ